MIGLDKAQAAYDAEEPDDMPKPEFTESHITQFIEDFANCGDNPAKWLIENGVSGAWEDFPSDVPESLQSLAQQYHWDVLGCGKHWRMFKRFAIEKFDSDNSI